MKKEYWLLVEAQGDIKYIGYTQTHYYAGRYAKPLAVKFGKDAWNRRLLPVRSVGIQHAEFGSRRISREEAMAILLTAEV